MSDFLPSERRAPTQKGEARRLRLLDVAAQAFLAHGYAATSIQAIVREAGGSVATAYQLFGNKEGLLVAVLQREFQSLEASVFPEGLPDLPVARMLPEIAERLLARNVTPRAAGFYRLLLGEGVRLPRLAEPLAALVNQRIHAPLEQCLRSAQRRGELVIDDPARAARMLRQLLNGIAHDARIVGGRADGPTAEDLAACRYAIAAFLRTYQP
ncbi:TetR/AcrR family transcriptional regulator [Verticiella sediminum]|uniref:TetR/AcrR family transcriptional regulator n=1 Tax=Verticiella sediminum TaxID=1247510 RepID=A0A556AWS0_9BURK|nr:TetR/AcrR family transcriptional regulator [Verticiella sediminum]TSH97402.1 TetR/AcrR family transcriptional regulator [Verticiella sediminum]